MNNETFRFYWPNLDKHNISDLEVIEALNDPDAYFKRLGTKEDPRYLVIGKLSTGKVLEVIYRIEETKDIFVFHAMKARDSMKKLYKKQTR